MNNIKTPKPLGYIASLDGLRAIAVLLVMLIHANFKLGVNGGVGVSVFFALSGFLITTLLLEEYNKNGVISFKGFYIRRTMRLFPPLYVMLGFVLIYAYFFRSGTDQQIIFQDIISSALYVYNIAWYWGWCAKEILLYHTWSLGVEEQFYLLWPLILYFFIRKNKIKILQVVLLLFILSTFILKTADHFPYLAGSIIKESIFLGCATALLRWTGLFKSVSTFLSFLFLIIILTIGIMPYKFTSTEMVFNFCSILSCLIILHLAENRESIVSKILSNKSMVFIGKISYSLYLWHLPVFRVFAYHSTLPPLVSFVGKFILSFILAITSWYTIEKVTTAYGRSVSKKITERSL